MPPTPPTRASGRPPRPTGRRRASHSLDAVVSEAVAILDESGESALTFRALASRLGGGVGSIYWYVSSKDELLGHAVDRVLHDLLDRTQSVVGGGVDPLVALREIATQMYDTIVDRPWLGAFFMREPGTQPNGLRLFDRVGQQLMRLDLSAKEQLDGVTAILGFVIGVASDRSHAADQEGPPEDAVPPWVGLEPADYPFLFHVKDEFFRHDDRAQFVAGLELLLEGLRLRADGA